MLDSLSEKNNPEIDHTSVAVKSTGRIRKIVVDRTSCIGVRSCALIAEKTFFMDEKDLAYVGSDTSAYEDDETIILAAESCPVLAIHLYDQDEKKVFPDR